MLEHHPPPDVRTLANSPACTVQRCLSGMILVHTEHVTLRFDQRMLRAIWRTLGAALERDDELNGCPRYGNATDSNGTGVPEGSA